MAKYKKNEETVDSTVSPSQSFEKEPIKKAAKVSRKPQFEVCCAHGLNFAVGGKYYNTSDSDFITSGGRIYKGIANDQEAMKEVYDFGPIAKNWVKAHATYTAKWEKFI